jgi:hypothetical protein
MRHVWLSSLGAFLLAGNALAEGPPLYPETLAARPPLPSPTTTADGRDLLVAFTAQGRWAVVAATPEDGERRRRYAEIDGRDFPTLARTGLHDPAELARTPTITGRSLAEITELGRPGRLSTDGFMAEDEEILGVIEGDNQIVSALGLTHPLLARPLLQLWSVVEADANVLRWNMALHRWDRFAFFLYNDREVKVTAHDTKGGQKSIFNDGIEGAFRIEIRRELTPAEGALLRERYSRLTADELATLTARLSTIQTGEMEPQYIMRYGFYEGHTPWRTDPIAIAFIFGLRTLEQIENAFPGRLSETLTEHFVS